MVFQSNVTFNDSWSMAARMAFAVWDSARQLCAAWEELAWEELERLEAARPAVVVAVSRLEG